MIEKISNVITCFVEEHFELEDKNKSYFNYGLQLLLGLIIEGIIILFTAWILNIFWVVLFAGISFLILRPSAGGIHLPTYFLCLIVSLFVFIVLGFISIFLQPAAGPLLAWLVVVTLTGYLMLNKYAPADTETVPITDPVQRKQLQKRSKIILVIWAVLAVAAIPCFPAHRQLILASSLGVTIEIIALHPFLFYLVKNYLPEHD